jgi:DnaK suppressor protein
MPSRASKPPKKAAAAKKAATKAAAPAKKAATKKQAAPVAKKAAPTAKATAKAPAPVKRAAKAPVLDKFLTEQVGLLEQERQTYTEQAESLKAEADQMAQEMEPGDIQFDEESGEGGTMNIDRERDLALSAQARAAVDEIDHALAKIANGTYGVCENCGQPIPKARLKALPFARLCIACKSGGLSRR